MRTLNESLRLAGVATPSEDESGHVVRALKDDACPRAPWFRGC